MTSRAAPLLALAVLALPALAACSSASPVAAPASATVTVPGPAACQALASWERNGTGTVARNMSLRKTFAGTARPLSRDFAAWVTAILNGSASASASAGKVAADCAAYGISIFPPVSPQPSAPVTSAPAAAPKTVATFSGSGTKTTPQFTTGGTWELTYSFDCTSFGSKGNFQVYEYSGDSLENVMVNDLAESKTGSTYAYGAAGTHHLEINSECSWNIKVTGEG